MKQHAVFLIALIAIKLVACEQDELARTISPATDEKTQQQAAHNVIRRLVHEKADNVAIKVNFKLPVNYFKVSNANKFASQ
jgi:predicted ABC-type ATPase